MKKKYLFYTTILIAILLSVFLCQRKNPSNREYRFLACISSFKRPTFVSGQVLRLLRQTYPVNISVSVKGVPSNYLDHTLFEEWKNEIKNGRISLRYDANRDQYSNFLDTVREIDRSKYDYFCKIDDDDWYHPDYFLHVNEWLNRENNISFSYTVNSIIIRDAKEILETTKNFTDLSGPTMCFSRDLIELALKIEEDPELAKFYLPSINIDSFRDIREDAFLDRLGTVFGKAQKRETSFWDISYNWQYPSVIRRNYR